MTIIHIVLVARRIPGLLVQIAEWIDRFNPFPHVLKT